jgi:hypothetical protein
MKQLRKDITGLSYITKRTAFDGNTRDLLVVHKLMAHIQK